MKTSNAMFHVKHTVAALVLGCVLAAPHAEAATDGCAAIGQFVLNVAKDRDAGRTAMEEKVSVASWDIDGKAKFSLYSVIDLVYAYPRNSPEREATNARAVCERPEKNL